MSIDLTRIEPLGIEPISEDSPAGENIQYEDEYAALQTAVEELTRLEGTGGEEQQTVGGGPPASWERVAAESIRLLGEKSKSFRLGVFLTLALVEEEGLPGFAAGMKLI